MRAVEDKADLLASAVERIVICPKCKRKWNGAIECDTCQQQQPNLNWSEEAMTLQQLLETTATSKNKYGNKVEVSPDFRVVVQQVKNGGIHFIIHPDGHNGETLDFVVTGNELKPL